MAKALGVDSDTDYPAFSFGSYGDRKTHSEWSEGSITLDVKPASFSTAGEEFTHSSDFEAYSGDGLPHFPWLLTYRVSYEPWGRRTSALPVAGCELLIRPARPSVRP